MNTSSRPFSRSRFLCAHHRPDVSCIFFYQLSQSGGATQHRGGVAESSSSQLATQAQPSQFYSHLVSAVRVEGRIAHNSRRTHPPLGRLRAVPYMHTITKVYAHEGLCTCTQRSMPHKGLVTRRAYKSQLPTWLTHAIRPANARADEHTAKT